MRLDRLLSITVLLINRDRVTARELARRFEVGIRTIYRDIEALGLAGIPVVSYQGNSGGFGLVENYRWDRQLLTMGDMVSILSALKGVNETLDDGELDGAIEKISSLVPPERAGELELGLEQFVVDMESWGGSGRLRERIRLVHHGVIDRRVLLFRYANSRGEDANREVEPMTLLLKGFTWYLFGYCRLRGDFRVFRLSRMRDIGLTGEHFPRRDASYRDYIEPDVRGTPATDAPGVLNLHLRFTGQVRFLVDDFFSEDDREVNPDGSIEIRVSYPDGYWVYSMLLSYADQVEVLSPVHVRQTLAEMGAAIAKKNSKVSET